MQGAGCRVQVSRFRVQGSGFRVQGSGFRAQGSGKGSEFRVQGLGLKTCCTELRLNSERSESSSDECCLGFGVEG